MTFVGYANESAGKCPIVFSGLSGACIGIAWQSPDCRTGSILLVLNFFLRGFVMKNKYLHRLLITIGCIIFIPGCPNGVTNSPGGGSSGGGSPGNSFYPTSLNNRLEFVMDEGVRFYSLATGTEIDPSRANTTDWDIAVEYDGYVQIYTNSGATAEKYGSGGQGGVTFTNETDFDVVNAGYAVTGFTGGNEEYEPYTTDAARWVGSMSNPSETIMNVMTYLGYVSGTGAEAAPFSPSPFSMGDNTKKMYEFNKKQCYDHRGGTMPPRYDPTKQVYIITHADGINKSKFQLSAVEVIYQTGPSPVLKAAMEFKFGAAPRAPDSIAVTTLPNITVYLPGEDLILNGLVVTGTYGEETQIETWKPENITGYDSAAPGPQTLTVTLGSRTATFDVTVGGEGLYWRRNNNSAGGAVAIDSFNLTKAMTWLNSNTSNNTTYTILLNSDQSLGATTVPSATGAKLILRGLGAERTVQLTGKGSLFTIQGSTLQLDENITLRGVNNNDSPLLGIWMDGTLLIMNQGSKITGNTNTGGSGGIATWGSDIIMNGGEISGNTGGGVYFSEGTFTMNSGKISGNSAVGGYGGGVYLADSGVFIMKGGEIGSNNADYGGGVCVKGDYGGANMRFEKTGGTIYGSSAGGNANTATASGAAVYLDSTKKLDATAGPETKLYAATNASGVWTYDGGGTIGDTSGAWTE
jgi:hypothetical protein